jgi:hypothetical protein
MSSPTKEQQKAIDVSGNNVIVSAGAGSGKTFVLKTRVQKEVLNGAKVDRLIILTFTNNAAAEMKQRIRNVIMDTPEIRNQITLSQDLWNNVHYGMRDVITSKKYYADYPIACAGKTGTAQESANKPNHALFVGYAPFDNPEIAIATRVANGYSSDYAAQIAKDVFTYYFKIKDTNELITGTASEAVVETTGD